MTHLRNYQSAAGYASQIADKLETLAGITEPTGNTNPAGAAKRIAVALSEWIDNGGGSTEDEILSWIDTAVAEVAGVGDPGDLTLIFDNQLV